MGENEEERLPHLEKALSLVEKNAEIAGGFGGLSEESVVDSLWQAGQRKTGTDSL